MVWGLEGTGREPRGVGFVCMYVDMKYTRGLYIWFPLSFFFSFRICVCKIGGIVTR